MAYWIFKVAKQESYPDSPGTSYVFDNTHSVHVKRDDNFLYLDKTNGYAFTAAGKVKQVKECSPSTGEAQRTHSVDKVFTAHLADVVWFKKPLSISSLTSEGRRNRARLGIIDVNLLGWSRSMPALSDDWYYKIIDLAEVEPQTPSFEERDYYVPDTWCQAKTRYHTKRFTSTVLKRSNSACIVCGTSLPGLVEVAHLSPYAGDKKNRANPANGIGLCKYCHGAFDLHYIAIKPDGALLVSPKISDDIALRHFSGISPEQRAECLVGVDSSFLELRVRWFNENQVNK